MSSYIHIELLVTTTVGSNMCIIFYSQVVNFQWKMSSWEYDYVIYYNFRLKSMTMQKTLRPASHNKCHKENLLPRYRTMIPLTVGHDSHSKLKCHQQLSFGCCLLIRTWCFALKSHVNSIWKCIIIIKWPFVSIRWLCNRNVRSGLHLWWKSTNKPKHSNHTFKLYAMTFRHYKINSWWMMSR